jgi:hypothetical protein
MRLRLAIFAVGTLACSRQQAPPEPVNRQLTRTLDVTGDGKPETITLFLKAPNYDVPFQWLLTIESAGRTIFEQDGDDTEVDALFDDREALPGCADYYACKEQYYLTAMLGNIVDHSWDPEDFLDSSRGGKLSPSVRGELMRCCSIMGPLADRIVSDLEARLRKRQAIVIVTPVSPVEAGPRLMYSPEAAQFIPIDPE